MPCFSFCNFGKEEGKKGCIVRGGRGRGELNASLFLQLPSKKEKRGGGRLFCISWWRKKGENESEQGGGRAPSLYTES